MPDIFDTHADTYSSDIDDALSAYGANHDFFTAHKAWLIEDILTRRGKNVSDTHILDVGCGVGKLHPLLVDKTAAISGVDVSSGSIEVARVNNPGVQYQSYDGQHLPFGDASVDMSLAICVFHHVPPKQWVDLAKEMLRVLKPDGLCVIIEHNPYNPVTRRIVNNCPIDEDAVLLSTKKLKDVLNTAGGTNVYSRATVAVPPVNAFLKKIDHFLGVMPFGAQHYVVAGKPNLEEA